MKVLKFGGSSVATPARVQSAIEIIKPYLSGDVAIVFSAFGGVTDSFELFLPDKSIIRP